MQAVLQGAVGAEPGTTTARHAHAVVDARAVQPDVPDLLPGSGHHLRGAARDPPRVRADARADGAGPRRLHLDLRPRPGTGRLARRPSGTEEGAQRPDRVDLDVRDPDRPVHRLRLAVRGPPLPGAGRGRSVPGCKPRHAALVCALGARPHSGHHPLLQPLRRRHHAVDRRWPRARLRLARDVFRLRQHRVRLGRCVLVVLPGAPRGSRRMSIAPSSRSSAASMRTAPSSRPAPPVRRRRGARSSRRPTCGGSRSATAASSSARTST